MKKIGENTKITLTISQLKWLVNESMDWYTCRRCGNKLKEDQFSLPGFLNQYNIPENQEKLWDKFIDSHMEEIKKLGIDEGGIYDKLETVCDFCCDEIRKLPLYEKLSNEWKGAVEEDLGGADKIKKLKDIANKVSENLSTVRSEIRRRCGEDYIDGWGCVYSRRISSVYHTEDYIVGKFKFPEFSPDDESNLKKVSDKIENGEPFELEMTIYRYVKNNPWWKDEESKKINLGIDLLTANKDDVVSAIDKHWEEMRSFTGA